MSSCENYFDQWHKLPLSRASGGIVTIWNSDLVEGVLIQIGVYIITTWFTNKTTGHGWYLTNVYGPNTGAYRKEFYEELLHIKSIVSVHWISMGDFNVTRFFSDRSTITSSSMAELKKFYRLLKELELLEI